MDNLKERGFVPGATVRQYNHIGSAGYDDAKILRVHDNGALDVEIDGERYGWSASTCSVVAPPNGGPFWALDAAGGLVLVGSVNPPDAGKSYAERGDEFCMAVLAPKKG